MPQIILHLIMSSLQGVLFVLLFLSGVKDLAHLGTKIQLPTQVQQHELRI